MSKSTNNLPPSCTALSKSIYLFNYNDADSSTRASSPSDTDSETILIYGWGDGSLKNVSKYAAGYHVLFPRARIIVTLSTTLQAVFSPIRQRVAAMEPILNVAFPSLSARASTDEKAPQEEKPRILVHAMSNSGIVSFLATLLSYRTRTGAPMPHILFVCDSAPGGASLRANLFRWSKAIAIMTTPRFLPLVLTRAFWASFLLVSFVLGKMLGARSLGQLFRSKLLEEDVTTKEARRLYMYSKEDDLVGWRDVEAHVEESREAGYVVEREEFEGSGHVEHMRMFPVRYWTRVRRAWEEAVKRETVGAAEG